MSKPLTVAAVEKYVPHAKRREIRDSGAPGLYLIVEPSGAKSWCLRFRRPDGRPAKMRLGAVQLAKIEPKDDPVMGGALTVRQAHVLANQIDRERARGIDVIGEAKAKKSRQQKAVVEHAANTFGTLAKEFFIDHRVEKWQTRPRRWRGDARMLGLDWPRGCDPATIEPKVIPGGLADTWADKPVAEIDGHDIHTVITDARKHGIPGLPRRNKSLSEARGRKMHGAMSVFFGWLLQTRKVTVNPCAGVWHPGPPPERDRVLTDAEIAKFWSACDKVGQPFAPLLKLLLLTGCRLNEVAGMRRTELNGDGTAWTIPGARTKNHRAHVVPLSPLVRDLIESAPPKSDLIFTTTGKTPVSSWSKVKERLDDEMHIIPPWRLHDLRRTTVTGMAELGIADNVIELAVNHVSGSRGGIAGVYNRSELLPERKAALERWATHIAGLVAGKPANVVAITKRAKDK